MSVLQFRVVRGQAAMERYKYSSVSTTSFISVEVSSFKSEYHYRSSHTRGYISAQPLLTRTRVIRRHAPKVGLNNTSLVYVREKSILLCTPLYICT